MESLFGGRRLKGRFFLHFVLDVVALQELMKEKFIGQDEHPHAVQKDPSVAEQAGLCENVWFGFGVAPGSSYDLGGILE